VKITTKLISVLIALRSPLEKVPERNVETTIAALFPHRANDVAQLFHFASDVVLSL